MIPIQINWTYGVISLDSSDIINKLNQDNEKSEIQRPYVVLAPTGVAAVNVHGQTIHSFFKLPLGAFLPQDEKYKLSNIKKCFSYNNDKIELIKHLSNIWLSYA